MPGHLLIAAAVAVFAYGCLAIIARHYGLMLPLFHFYLNYAVQAAGPPVLAVLSVIAWCKARQWRLMAEMRAVPPGGAASALARGEMVSSRAKSGSGSLERLSARCLLLATLALPYWLNLPGPESLLLAGLAIWLVLRWALRSL